MRVRFFVVVSTLFVMALLSVFIALSFGSTQTPFSFWNSVLNESNGLSQTILLDIRLPRTLNAFVTGGLLALAGVLMQALLRNPLADPYVLGVSGGAAVAALISMLVGLSAAWMSGGALIGAIVSILIVFYFAHGSGTWTSTRLLLTGVVIASGWGALISFILTLSPNESLRGMLFWLMGDLSLAPLNIAGIAILVIGFLISMYFSRSLNLLVRGVKQAGVLGVSIIPMQIILYFLASMLTAMAVIQAGSIGFIGLVIPHMLRLIVGSDHRLIVPSSILLGGSYLCIADTLARTLFAPQQLPVGVITALVGVPLFLYILNKSMLAERYAL